VGGLIVKGDGCGVDGVNGALCVWGGEVCGR